MAIVKPFCGIRPGEGWADKVISLPYDVMNREEATKMAEGNPYSFLRICRSEIDLPEEENPYSDAVYKKAKINLDNFLANEIFVREEKPIYYIYRMTMDVRSQTGIVACVSVDDYRNGVIKKHELTRVEKEQDRIRHFDCCNANTEPILLTYRDNMKIRLMTEGWVQSHEAEYKITTEDQVQHMVWSIDDDEIIASLEELFSEIPFLYIADGHHRSESAAKVSEIRRKEHPDYDGSEEFNRFMAVLFPDTDLNIYDYNRVVEGLNGLSQEEFLQKVRDKFSLEEKGAEPYQPEAEHTFGMYLNGIWYKLEARAGTFDPSNVISALDASILQENLICPILGIEDVRRDKRIDFVGGIRGLTELERRVKEDMTVAFALYPVSISRLMQVADQNMIMPPKSTWFEPKPGSGLFLHEL